MAVLSRAGCNSGACHGNLNGKGGFKLSLRGEDPAADFAVLTRDMHARRIDAQSPDASLLLLKGAGLVPHEGGVRFHKSSLEYRILRAWIAGGCRTDPPHAPRLVSISVDLANRIVFEPEDRFQVRVRAKFADGTDRDVTALAAFEFTSTGTARITAGGEVIREQTGETVLLARYLGQVVPVRVAFLPDRPNPDLATVPIHNEIDRLARNQWKGLRISPAPLAADHVFLRRVFLDTIGLLPTPEESRIFLASTDANKRERLIDTLLARSEFAEFWAQKWSDLLRNEEKSLDRKGVAVFHRWIAAQLATDRPLNEFARDILAARGSTYANPPANFWRAVRDPLVRAESAAQVFLGVRVACARCHNHPFDRWTMDDYYGFAAFFSRIDYRVLENKRRDELDKHEFVGEQIVFSRRDGEMMHPRTKKAAAPRFLGGLETPDTPDRLDALAEWIAHPQNPFFARAQANRIWLHLTGRGLVDPNDDFRATNPPSNPELLAWLAKEFADGGFRLKPLMKRILMSRTYQLASAENESHFSAAIVQPLKAEQLLDALARVSGSSARFRGYPRGIRATQLPATPQSGGRSGAGTVAEQFLKTFGKPERLLTCECERNDDPGLLQAFQMITGELQNAMIRDPDNRIGKLLDAGRTDGEMLDEFYLAALCRRPTEAESERMLAHTAAAKDRRVAWEDVLWAIVNSKEFLVRR
ncbi:MAG: DUF1549 and DUF1553 domain-containing protein [Gemmataceae bacterium]